MISSDFVRNAWTRIVPEMQPGTLRHRVSSTTVDTYVDYALEFVKFKKLTKEDEQTLIGYPSNLAYLSKYHGTIQVWKEHLDDAGAPDPAVDDLFVIDSTTYLVLEVSDKKLFGNVFNCHCKIETQ